MWAEPGNGGHPSISQEEEKPPTLLWTDHPHSPGSVFPGDDRMVGYTSIRLLSMWTSFLSPTVHWKRETAPAGFVKVLSRCRLCFFFPVILQHLLFSFQQDRLWPSLKVLEGVCLFVHFRCKMVTFLPFIQLPLTLCIKAVLCSRLGSGGGWWASGGLTQTYRYLKHPGCLRAQRLVNTVVVSAEVLVVILFLLFQNKEREGCLFPR